ncbi:MAG: YeeE/YedE family protein [Gammaproteobacteria bacterium]|nr:YeeE/YedE family protein [Gammaproteobacteria bacterium]NNF61752.1 YeeE/YedE family protein [Gammaproteobacteria bacterium]NNM21516.1 YeeE/YedE family protein [Gammaproteobacteria bacterium]
MTRNFAAPLSGLVAGIIFGAGLGISEMANPEKVLAFLDVLGNWDPSLLFTMGGAVGVTFLGYRLVLHRGPVFEQQPHLPTKTDIDRQLLAGAAVFGIGWGLAGYCPGPAVTGLGSGVLEPVLFVAAMLVGSQVERLWLRRTPTPETS